MIYAGLSRIHYSRNILFRMAIAVVVALGLIAWQYQLLADIYLRNQLTAVGWAINGGIVLLFVAGLGRLVQLFWRYMREEEDLNRFIGNLQRVVEPEQGIRRDAIIADRYRMLTELYARRAPINQSALAATLMAQEAAFVSFPKFVNNILILTGVFGTIVSLSIALLGASDMLGNAAQVSGLNTVIHGMSTALSTTMTAILAYLFFGYFYLKLNDAQSFVISRVEQVTTTTLMPRFQVQSETIIKDFADMVRAAAGLVQRMDETQATFASALDRMEGVFEAYRSELAGVSDAVRTVADRVDQLDEGVRAMTGSNEDVKDLLRAGFRLRDGER